MSFMQTFLETEIRRAGGASTSGNEVDECQSGKRISRNVKKAHISPISMLTKLFCVHDMKRAVFKGAVIKGSSGWYF